MATDNVKEKSVNDLKALLSGDLQNVSESTTGILLTIPLIIILLSLYLYPILKGFQFSIQDINLFAAKPEYIGLQHYIDLLGSQRFYNALMNTIIYTIATVLVTVLLGVGTSLLLNRNFVGERFVTGLILSPYLIPVVGIVIIFRWLFNGLNGVANYVLVAIGIVHSPIAWYSSPSLSMVILVITSGWALYPFVTLLVLAKLQTIPEEYYEAAKLMGASNVKQFISITLPQLRDVLFIAVFLRLLFTFNLFDIVWLSTHGGPGTSTETLPIMAYQVGVNGLDLGTGSAVAVLTFVVLAALTLIYFRIFNSGSGTI